EDRFQRVALWERQLVEVIEDRRAELVEAAEGELHLRLDPGHRRDTPPRSVVDRIAQEGALAGPGLAAEHDGSALTLECVGQRRFEELAFRMTSKQPHRRPPPWTSFRQARCRGLHEPGERLPDPDCRRARATAWRLALRAPGRRRRRRRERRSR